MKHLSIIFIICFLFTDPLWSQVSRRTPIVEVVEKVGPAIVNISTQRLADITTSPFPNDPFLEFFGRFQPRQYETTSLGSGIIIDKQGFIVTNFHVIQRATKIVVAVQEQDYKAEVVASSREDDIALLKIDVAHNLPTVALGKPGDILTGETVVALGNPFGLNNSVTTGVVSAKDRSLSLDNNKVFTDFIQTDAAINPGNSGGALVNIHGELIGMNTAIHSKGQGLGFAIPIKRMLRVLGEITNHQKIKGFWLGIELKEIIRAKKIQVKISKVHPNSPGQQMGLQVGDVIVSVDSHPVDSRFAFEKALYLKESPSIIRLVIRRKKQTQNIFVPIKPLPKSQAQKNLWTKLGVYLKRQNPYIIVAEVRRGGPASRIGVQKGDRILSLAGYPIYSLDRVQKILQQLRRGNVVSLMIERRGRRLGGSVVID